MTDQDHSPLTFDVALTKLEQLVEQLEQGDLTLEETLQRFEHGMALVRDCQAKLQCAEQRIELLAEHKGDLEVTPFDGAKD